MDYTDCSLLVARTAVSDETAEVGQPDDRQRERVAIGVRRLDRQRKPFPCRKSLVGNGDDSRRTVDVDNVDCNGL